MKITLTIILSIILTNSLLCQNKSYLDRTYNAALSDFQRGNFERSKKYLYQILEDDSSYFKAYPLLGEIFITFEEYDSLLYYYRAGVRHCAKKNPEIFFTLANYEFYMGNIEQALQSYKKFLDIVPKSNLSSKAREQIKRCQFALHLINNPVNFEPQNLGEAINSVCDEYYPYIAPNDSMIIFTRKVPLYKGANPASDNTQEDFYISYLTDEGWTKAVPLPGNVNTRSNEGAQTVTADGKYMVFTACNRPDGKGSCDLYYSEFINGAWTKPKNLHEINTYAWESQPSISADGRTLYFASERENGTGNSDIYVSYRNEYGTWSKPQVLDTTINTPMAETSPFIHPDGKTLYFCSNGHYGVGGFDIFVSYLNDYGTWSKPQNLGYPINTTKNEIGLVVSSTGKQAYITSSRDGGYGLNDIYVFDLPASVQAEEVTFIKGKIVDAETNKPLPVYCEIVDLKNNKVVYASYSDSTSGTFLLGLTQGKEYGLFFSRQGYLFRSENIRIDDSYSIQQAFNKTFAIEPIKPGKSIVLPNIFFETDSFRLKPNSYAELNKVVKFLNDNPTVKIEISGHTDNSGQENYNKQLSEKRAKAVYQYIINRNIDSSRVSYVGYGSSKPIATNSTVEGKALNRRTEMKIVP